MDSQSQQKCPFDIHSNLIQYEMKVLLREVQAMQQLLATEAPEGQKKE